MSNERGFSRKCRRESDCSHRKVSCIKKKTEHNKMKCRQSTVLHFLKKQVLLQQRDTTAAFLRAHRQIIKKITERMHVRQNL